jgi:hypothetical protein
MSAGILTLCLGLRDKKHCAQTLMKCLSFAYGKPVVCMVKVKFFLLQALEALKVVRG